MGGEPLDHPVVFMKNPASVIGDGDAIVIPAICQDRTQVDYEGELAVILAENCRDVEVDVALDHVHGYAAANDVTARWWQREGSGGQWMRGKSFDTFCPMGAIASAEAVSNPQNLVLRTRVNGQLVQKASTAMMERSVAELIAELSRGMTLLAGTVILTGTPEGVGAARTPPSFLGDGDEVEVSIEDVGRVTNRVVYGQ